jgi:hypothetical protein
MILIAGSHRRISGDATNRNTSASDIRIGAPRPAVPAGYPETLHGIDGDSCRCGVRIEPGSREPG